MRQGEEVYCERVNPNKLNDITIYGEGKFLNWINSHYGGNLRCYSDGDVLCPKGEIIKICLSDGNGSVLENFLLCELGTKIYVMNDQGTTVESMMVCPVESD